MSMPQSQLTKDTKASISKSFQPSPNGLIDKRGNLNLDQDTIETEGQTRQMAYQGYRSSIQ